MQYLTRNEVAAIVAALALLVVGVSLVAVPPTAPAAPRTVVEAVTTSPSAGVDLVLPSPSPSPAPPSPSPSPSGAAAQAPPVAAPITMTGPDHLQPWQTGVYRVTFTGAGWRTVSLWWSGAAMAKWSFHMLSGHEELDATSDRLSGPVKDTTVIELDLTPSGWPGGRLVIEGQDGGSPLGLAVVEVADHR